MNSVAVRLGWLKSGLFWRTFFLLGLLIALSMAAWVVNLILVERGPQAQRLAAQMVSMVTVTRAALTHSAPALRKELLIDLASHEGIRVYPQERTDRIEPAQPAEAMQALQQTLRDGLGPDTILAGKVNGAEGLWISFKIEGEDEYWLRLERARIERFSHTQWLGWGGAVLLLSLLGAALLSRLVTLPLARISAASRAIALGRTPPPLPECGPAETIEANRSFNQMVRDLNRIESDRAVVLAGISHDLRTPLTRMQLEVEMANLSDESREGMQSDLSQMDAIIAQFLDYARPSDNASFCTVNLSRLAAEAARGAERLPGFQVNIRIDPQVTVLGNATELRRVLANLVENARRYGKGGDGQVTLDIVCAPQDTGGGRRILVEVADRGAGVPPDQVEHLLRPFTRLDAARSQANGAGLGLAIVDRVVRRHGGELRLRNREGGGLAVQITLPSAHGG